MNKMGGTGRAARVAQFPKPVANYFVIPTCVRA